jgi:hypothetical protein
MNSRLFNIGDIVSFKSHPYLFNLTNIIISGDHVMVPPLMVITDILKTEQKLLGNTENVEVYVYSCVYFSPKIYKFVFVEINESDLKLICRNNLSINKNALKRGDKVTLKSMEHELAKKKSSLAYEDNSINTDKGSTTINSLLSYLPPVLQVLDLKKHTSKHSIANKKTGEITREIYQWNVQYLIFDPIDNKKAELILPLEVLTLIEDADENAITLINEIISKSGYLLIKLHNNMSFVKPRNIVNRGGMYFVRAFDYLSNKVEELSLIDLLHLEAVDSPFSTEVPTFDLEAKPESATPAFIHKEITDAISASTLKRSFIRIKYKNRNDQISHRTLKNYKLKEVKESGLDVTYLIGFCYLRQSERTFRVDRIQSLQQLKLSFPVKTKV